MAVKIRLSRVGKTNRPYFRIIAIDSRKKQNGEALEILGAYDPIVGKLIQFREERINDWVAKGAIVSDAVKRLKKVYKKSSNAES